MNFCKSTIENERVNYVTERNPPAYVLLLFSVVHGDLNLSEKNLTLNFWDIN